MCWAYIALGPCQPRMKIHDFPQHQCEGMHRFNPKEFKWLEYSVDKDVAFALFAICSKIA